MTSRAEAAEKVVELLDSAFIRALGEPPRLEVLRALLRVGPADVGAVAAELPQDRSVVSRHLQTLEDAGIVKSQRDGRRRVYSIDGAGFLGQLERIVERARALAPLCCPPEPPLVEPSRLRRR